VKVRDVLADEVMNLDVRIAPPVVEFFTLSLAPFECRSDVADRRVKPDVPIMAIVGVWNREAEIRGRARNVPIAQRLTQKRALQPFGDIFLQMTGGLRPALQERVALLRTDEEMFFAFQFGNRPRNGAFGIDQIGSRVGRTAPIAAVAVLIRRTTAGTRPSHEPIRQKQFFDRVVKLDHVAAGNQAGSLQAGPDLIAEFLVLRRVGAAIVVEQDVEAGKIAHVGGPHIFNHRFRRATLLAGAQHDGGAMRVVGTQEQAGAAAQSLETDPDVGLDVFDQVAEMDVSVGVRQGSGDEQAGCGHQCGDVLGLA